MQQASLERNMSKGKKTNCVRKLESQIEQLVERVEKLEQEAKKKRPKKIESSKRRVHFSND